MVVALTATSWVLDWASMRLSCSDYALPAQHPLLTRRMAGMWPAIPRFRPLETARRGKVLDKGQPRLTIGPEPVREETMLGLMQEWPLLCHKILDHAARQHGNSEVGWRQVEGPIVRTTYRDIRTRSRKIAQRLERDGFREGDRIATLAWNSARHIEAWYGIMGMGGVYHTLNPRLFPDQI